MSEHGSVSSSSPQDVSVRDKTRENAKLAAMWIERFRAGGDIDAIVDTIEEYCQIFEAKTGRKLSEGSIFEIGFGARPLRMMALQGMGFDARGVDLERPVLGRGLGPIIRVLRTNGAERAVKSAVRSALFDRREQRALARRLARLNARPALDHDRLIVGDASRLALAENSIDLIVSEGVFEHVRPDALERLVPRMATWLRPDGLALIRLCVYTGISGNHLIDWYPHRVLAGRLSRTSEPWEHLRKRRFTANTYLNRLRLAEYRALFEKQFVIEGERSQFPDLGRHLLTPAVAAELTEWSDEELLSNLIQFVLRVKSDQ